MFKIEWTVHENGERLPMLLNQDGTLELFSNLYVMAKLRETEQANTISNSLQDISHFLLWEEINQRKLADEISKGHFLNEEDIVSIRDHCRLKKSSVINAKKQDVISLELYSETQSKLEPVMPHTHYRRFLNITHYIEFLYRTILKNRKNLAQFNVKIEKLISRFKAHKPSTSNSSNRDPYETSADPKAFEAFMKDIHYKSLNNPFKNNRDKIRNYLMVAVTYWTGLRAGELLSLKLENISQNLFEPYIVIKRNHDDPIDPRKKQPTAKTLERKIPIPKNIHKLLLFYTDNIRRPITQNKHLHHPFVFIAHKGPTKGQPMSNNNYQLRVIGTLKNMKPEYEQITRHGFRHYWNARYSQEIDRRNKKIHEQIIKATESGNEALATQLRRLVISDNHELTFRQYLNGHSNKASGEIYLRRHAAQLAEELTLAVQEDLTEEMTNGEMALKFAELITHESNIETEFEEEKLKQWL
jgi:integrase